MTRGTQQKYVIHDCVVCGNEISTHYIKNGEGKTYPPCLYNKKKTCCEACKQKLLKQYRQKYWEGVERVKQKGKNTDYVLTPMDIFNGRTR